MYTVHLHTYTLYSIILFVVAVIAVMFIIIGMNWLLRCVEKLRVYLFLAGAVAVLSAAAFIPANFSNGSAFVAFFVMALLLSIMSGPISLIQGLISWCAI